ncbi:hypothetical protein OG474_35870 [Kribbella sp. NBC_01505]|uniref:hypothetical protein n=1 Tax=Kribbella sp. NBC_01505 TaxID=2903580 RepID=UPI003865CEDD
MRRKHLVPAVAGLLLVAGCGGPAGQTAVSEPPSQLAAWRATTGTTVSRLLVKQGDGAVIGQPSGLPSTTDTFAAAITLQLADRPGVTVDAPWGKNGLVDKEGADSLFVTWLAARASTSKLPRETVERAVQQRMAGLSKDLAKGSLEAAGAYLSGGDLLRLLKLAVPAPLPVPGACAQATKALAEQDLIAASTWSELAAARQPCAAKTVDALAALAKTRLAARDGDIGPYTAAELWAGQRALVLAKQSPVVPAVCPALLSEKRSIRVSRDTMTYLACADAVTSTGARPALSDDVAGWMRLVVETDGKLAEQQTLDGMGKLYETQTLRALGFSSDVLTAVRTNRATDSAGSVEGDALRAFTEGRLPAPELPKQASEAAVLLASASVLGGAKCPATAPRDFTAKKAGAGSDSDALFREAVAAKALERCGGDSAAWAASVLKRLPAAEGALGNDLIGWWKAEEARCVLGVRPSLTEQSALRLLPDYSLGNPKFDLSLDTLYAAVRLSEIADSGCARPFWDVSKG